MLIFPLFIVLVDGRNWYLTTVNTNHDLRRAAVAYLTEEIQYSLHSKIIIIQLFLRLFLMIIILFSFIKFIHYSCIGVNGIDAYIHAHKYL